MFDKFVPIERYISQSQYQQLFRNWACRVTLLLPVPLWIVLLLRMTFGNFVQTGEKPKPNIAKVFYEYTPQFQISLRSSITFMCPPRRFENFLGHKIQGHSLSVDPTTLRETGQPPSSFDSIELSDTDIGGLCSQPHPQMRCFGHTTGKHWILVEGLLKIASCLSSFLISCTRKIISVVWFLTLCLRRELLEEGHQHMNQPLSLISPCRTNLLMHIERSKFADSDNWIPFFVHHMGNGFLIDISSSKPKIYEVRILKGSQSSCQDF